MAQLMVQRTDAYLALHGFKGRLDLCQLYITLPEHRGILAHQVRTQQIVTILQLRRGEFWTVDAELETLTCHRLPFARELQVQEAKSAARFFPCAADA